MKMKLLFQEKLFLVSVFALAISVIVLSSIAVSRMTFYSFSISLPDEVIAKPGEAVTIDGDIQVTGFYWLHRFELVMDGIDYDYEIDPEYWQDIRIIREWNPRDGVYRIPETFSITINVPEDASGLYIATVTGQEHHSWREVSNSTFFVLKIEGVPPVEEPEKVINVTDILVPEEIESGEQFSITFRVDNYGEEKTAVEVSILAPEDWDIEQESQYLDVAAGESAAGMFKLTPTESAGTISLYLEYPYREEIINFTRVGPYLQPVTTTTTTTTTVVEKPFIVEIYDSIVNTIGNVWNSIKVVVGGDGDAVDTFTPLTLGIIGVLIVVIIWLVWGIVKDIGKGGSKKPETMKKEMPATAEVGVVSESGTFDGVDKL